MKKVLMILYYWPPSGGAGVQRCLKMVKYLRDFGWEPIVYTAENAHYPIIDPSLEQDIPPGQVVLKHPIWEPYELYKRFVGKGKDSRVYSGFLAEDKKASWTERLSIWIRGNFFIPDARRFWIGPSIRYLKQYLRENPVDAIFSSGPPHSVHLIAKGIKEATGLPWLADFRDPWTNIDFYDQLRLTKWADRRHRRLERSVIETADQLSTVSWVWADEFRQMGARQVEVITNGFDHEDFAFEPQPLEEGFLFSHIGYLNADRNPPALWRAFGELCEEIPAIREVLRLRFVGKTDVQVFEQIKAAGLEALTEKRAYLPHHEAIRLQARSPVLILPVNNVPNVMGHIPGKTFEYLASRRPILCIAPEASDLARIITTAGAGVVCHFEDKEKMKREIFKLYQRYKKNQLSGSTTDLSVYTRKHATGQVAGLLNKLVQH
ncbi:MAG: glycosyl transferase family 1 [Bacteroidetes bacterium]|nr:MAG: glycosyl transferase family 1 [Bacteroidota bacterium]